VPGGRPARQQHYMTRESVIFGIAGVFFGLLGGWILGSQLATGPGRQAAPGAVQQAAASQPRPPAAPPLDETRAKALLSTAESSPSDSATRVELANLYLDAERFEEAVRWYEAALKIDPKNVNASTDLGIAYYYTNQADRALAQFERSLAVDPRHSKTLLNMGIVRAFAKEDVEGATAAWERALEVAPAGSVEATTARRLLDGIRAHPTTGEGPAGRAPGQPD
jgi:tetratricopeptide (TPR) repeat protein